MSGRKRPGGAGAKVAPSDGLNEDAQDIIKENLEVMYDIVMQIREDEEFAKSIYANCPRLQHMLEKRPDLRPIFEDQRLVAINFEQVYREAGGVLPEDEEEEELKKKKTNYIAVIVNSPCFKILKVFLLFKKIIACIFGGGMALLISMWKCLCCCFDDPSDLVDEDDLEDEEPENTPSKEALYRAADHMEDPEVQKQMNDLLVNDPDGLADAIEEDPELRELRDTNPLCAELMTDPETMRILTDPENLRALGDAPDLIEADFNDPDWTPPGDDLEAGNSSGNADLKVPETDAVESYNDSFQAAEYASEDGADIEFENDEPDIEEGGSLGQEGDDQAEEEAGEEEEEEMEEFELGEEENNDKNANANAQKKQNKQGQQQQQRQGGFFAQVGAGITDMVAAQLVGVGISELTGQDDPFAGLEEAEGVADSGEGAAATANQAADMAAASETLLGEDMAGNLEDGVDELENTHDETNGGQGKAAAAGAGAAAGGVAVAGVAMTRGTGDDEEDGEGDGLVKEEKKKRFGVVGNWASAISTAGKEYIATALLGDDLGEMLVEKIEDKESKDGDDDDESAKSDEQTAEVDPMDDANNASKRSLQ